MKLDLHRLFFHGSELYYEPEHVNETLDSESDNKKMFCKFLFLYSWIPQLKVLMIGARFKVSLVGLVLSGHRRNIVQVPVDYF